MPFTESVPATTQVRAPWKAVVRTVVAIGVPLAAGLPLALDIASGGNPEQLGGWAVAVIAVSGAITRTLANPKVEDFLRRYAPWLAAAASVPAADDSTPDDDTTPAATADSEVDEPDDDGAVG